MTTTAAVEVAGRGAAAREDVVSRMRRPVFLLVAEDGPRREALTTDLRRRYDADYQVVGVASAGAALTMLADFADSGAVVALLFADERLAEMPAVDFLASAHGLHPGAKRVLLVARGDWSAAQPAVSAMALGKIDYHLWVPWYPERVLYSAVTEFLAAWDKSREPSFAAVRIAGPAHSARSHRLRDVLSRGGVPYLVRGPGLHPGMSEYLITEISKTANIAVRPATEVIDGGGHGSLETLTLRHRPGGATEVVPASALFVMIGTEPRTQWLEGSVTRDPQGFVLTGRDLSPPGRRPERWPLSRLPLLLETSIPGVFAAGDVRHRSVKRVASAIGEGAIAVQLLHEYLYLQAGHE